MQNQLDQLKKYTTVVADTGDFESISSFLPTDTTTNPSLILAASKKPEYLPLIKDAIASAGSSDLHDLVDQVLVSFAKKILEIVPGRVSIEVDSRLSFDTEKTIARAKKLIDLFKKNNIDKSRILIKIASTWEGIQAAKKLEEENIHCNMTLIFSLMQAIACAQANATLISPFVGRILDWHKNKYPEKTFTPAEDPGVLSVHTIYKYYKTHGHKTQIMGASFRTTDQIRELTGCDLLTISPSLLLELQSNTSPLEAKLHDKLTSDLEKTEVTKVVFEASLENDEMAKEKLFEGIDKFNKDLEKLEELLKNI